MEYYSKSVISGLVAFRGLEFGILGYWEFGIGYCGIHHRSGILGVWGHTWGFVGFKDEYGGVRRSSDNNKQTMLFPYSVSNIFDRIHDVSKHYVSDYVNKISSSSVLYFIGMIE